MHMTLPLVHATLKLLIYNLPPYNTSIFEIYQCLRVSLEKYKMYDAAYTKQRFTMGIEFSQLVPNVSSVKFGQNICLLCGQIKAVTGVI